MTDREGQVDGDEARRRLHEIAVRDEPLRSRVDDVLSLGVEYLGVENGHVAEIDAESGDWEAVASTDPPEGSIPAGLSLELATTYCRHAIQRDHPFARHDVEATDLGDDPAYEATQLRCYHGAAITIDEDCFGTVCFVSADPRAEPFSDEEKLFVDLAATLLGHAIQRSRDERRVTERGRALAERAERLRSLVAASFDVVVQLDGDGTIVDVAAAQRDLLGYDPDELRGRSYAALMATQEAFERASAALRRVRDGTPARELGLEVLDSDGRLVPVDVSAAPVFDVDASDDDALPIGIVEPEVDGTGAGGTGGGRTGGGRTGVDGSGADGTGATGADGSEVGAFGVGGSATASGVGDLLRDGWSGGLPEECPDSAGGPGAPTVESGRSTATGADDTDADHRDAVDAADAVEPGAGDRDVAGVTVVLRDASRRQRYEHLVSVLQRVLRHNVRNALNVVHGAAEEVEPGDEASQREVSRIQATCADLLALSEKAGTLEAAIGEAEDPRPTDLGAVAERVADRVGERYPDAEATVEVGGRPVARATESLERAVEELVENAAKHGGQGVGVEIRAFDRGAGEGEEERSGQRAAERAEDGASDVVLEVADDGPGLPDQERAVLTAGEESPLEHGSGLGHWFVYWIATSLGGTVEASVDEGTTVRLLLPGAAPEESDEFGDSA